MPLCINPVSIYVLYDIDIINFCLGTFCPGTFYPGTFCPWTFCPGTFCPGTFYPGTFVQGHFVLNILSEYPNGSRPTCNLLDAKNSVALTSYKPSFIRVYVAHETKCHFSHLLNITML